MTLSVLVVLIVTYYLCVCAEQQSASSEKKAMELQEQLVSNSKECEILKEENSRLSEWMQLHNSLHFIISTFAASELKKSHLMLWGWEFSNEQPKNNNNPEVVFIVCEHIILPKVKSLSQTML